MLTFEAALRPSQEGDCGAMRRARNGDRAAIFRRGAEAHPFASRTKIAFGAPSFAPLRPRRGAAVRFGAARRLSSPRRPREARRQSKECIMSYPAESDDIAADSGASHLLLQEMQLCGHRPYEDEPDPRPLPDARIASGAIADMFDALTSCLEDTRIEPDLEELLWNLVNLFHRAGQQVERKLDDNEQAQRQLQREQDGSEIRSVELERATQEGISLIERRDAMEFFREAAADQYRVHLRNVWTPRHGSRVQHRTMTASLIDSRDFLDARLREKAAVLLPEGTRIAFTGGSEGEHGAIWDALDKARARYPDMVLLHGATPTGAERAAACWADSRGVPQVAFRPDWNRHGKAAPFKRNDRMLEALPVGLIVFAGTGIQANLADKAKKLGIPVWDFRKRA
jgi:hypothetical protein